MRPSTFIAGVYVYLALAVAVAVPQAPAGLGAVQKPLNLDPEHAAFQGIAFHDKLAPILNVDNVDGTVPDKYIVVFHDDVSTESIQDHQSWIKSRYEMEKAILNADMAVSAILKQRLMTNEVEFFNVHGIFKGYSGFFTKELVNLIRAVPQVKFLEKDTKVEVSEFEIEKNAPWGISRVSSRAPLAGETYDYLFDNDGGRGVTAYVIDTGIKVNHEEFEGRATWGESVAFPKLKLDGNGHGTHCAGIIGSKTYGIAKAVDLVAVAVMNLLGSGTTSDIIKGIEFVVNDHNTKVAARTKGFKGSVINMSLGGSAQESLDLAINAATTAGIHVAVAAGNDNEDACNYSPAKASGPITVGASSITDDKADFSNWGSCVDVFAPGEDILSTYIFGDSQVMSGTSMASPHVAGLLSYYLSLQPDVNSQYFTGLLEPAVLKQKLLKFATKGALGRIADTRSPNLLIYNGAGQNLTDFWAA